MKRLLMFMAMLAFAFSYSPNVDAQGFLKNLGKKVVEKAKQKVEDKVLDEADKAADAVLNGDAEDSGSKSKSNKAKTDADAEVVDDTPDAVAQNVKSDFVRGSVILFEDDFANEQIGEFPSKWDVNGGSAETASINGKKYLNFTDYSNEVAPLMTNMESYLPDVFTLEWDVFCSKSGEFGQADLEVVFMKKGSWNDQAGNVSLIYRSDNPDASGGYRFEKGVGSSGDVNGSLDWGQIKNFFKIGQWNHFAVSFNKRAFKFYINDNRVINLPNVLAPERISIICTGDYKYRGFTNVVLAAGAVDY